MNMVTRNVRSEIYDEVDFVDVYMRFDSEAGQSYAESVLEQQRFRGPSIPWIFRPNRVIAKWLGIQNGTPSLPWQNLLT